MGGFRGSGPGNGARHLPHAPPASCRLGRASAWFAGFRHEWTRSPGRSGPRLHPPLVAAKPRPHLGASGGGAGEKPMGRGRAGT